jgi:ABC-2 type transport system ATP-binding protein
MIKAINLTKCFGSLTAVDCVNLEIGEGEIFALVGPDGAGKTTVMRLLAAIMEPTSGDAWVAGFHIVNQAELLKDRIGYMSQRFGLYPDLTVEENLNFYAEIYCVPRKEKKSRMDMLLASSDLIPFRKRLAGDLSGGMKQKLGISCAIIHNPRVLFLDEPTGGVDPVSRREIWKLLYRLMQDKVAILVTTSYMDEAERCSRLGLMHEGKLLTTGTPDQIISSWKETVLEIRPTDPRQTIVPLRKAFGEEAVRLHGNRIHVVARDLKKTKIEVENLLIQAQSGPFTIFETSPSLEDIFISYLSHPVKGDSNASN